MHNVNSQTPTAAATLALRRKAALRHQDKYAAALRLIGYTVTPPEGESGVLETSEVTRISA